MFTYFDTLGFHQCSIQWGIEMCTYQTGQEHQEPYRKYKTEVLLPCSLHRMHDILGNTDRMISTRF